MRWMHPKFSHTFDLLCALLDSIHRHPSKTNYIGSGVECIVDYQGSFYKITIQEAYPQKPAMEMAAYGE